MTEKSFREKKFKLKYELEYKKKLKIKLYVKNIKNLIC